MMKHQSGSVLLVALGFTLVISIMVVSAVQRAGLQQKMTANLKDKELSFQAAESALKQGEAFLATSSEVALFGKFDDTQGLYTFDKQREFTTKESWQSLSTREADRPHQVASKPVYIVEELPEIPEMGDSLEIPRPVSSPYYRITAQSNGGTEQANTVLQVMYKK